MKRVLIVGAGLSGATMARLLVDNHDDVHVDVIDKRNHIAGNAYDYLCPETNVRIHKYGAHIFHTPDADVWDFVNRFAEFNDYRHHVRAAYQGKNYSLPINLDTINAFYGTNFDPEGAQLQIKKDSAEIKGEPQNLEEKAISLIGRPLYEAFVKGYTIKQWARDPKELPADIISRLPVRYNYNTRYFNDRFEGIPVEGYTAMVEKMFDDLRIRIHLGVDYYDSVFYEREYDAIYFTGPIDKFFKNAFGYLSWRTVDFEFRTMENTDDALGTSVQNWNDSEIGFTRTIEFKHFHPERYGEVRGTVYAHESSRMARTHEECFYPVRTKEDMEKLAKYKDASKIYSKILFGGRLGTYKYLDMHQAIGKVLKSDFGKMQTILSKS